MLAGNLLFLGSDEANKFGYKREPLFVANAPPGRRFTTTFLNPY